MNERDRIELARLSEQHKRLETELQSLSLQLESLEDRVKAGAADEIRATQTTQASKPPSATSVSSVAATAVPVPPLAVPPLINQARPSIPVPPTAPNHIPGAPAATGSGSSAQPHLRIAREASVAPTVAKIPVSQTPPSLTHTPQPPPKTRSLEMQVGTYWLVRIGVVMVLTGLVFFGNLAYQNYISRFGPGGKVCLLYLVSAVMLGGGWWWQRKAVKETLRNYAQVLFAGGLAGAYFTTYAAHHLERLRVINSALLDGLLLLGCAAFMIWAAERKRSEVLGFFAVGLAYYTSIITRVGHFTLWSNLVLSAASVFFLVRNRWAALSFGSLIATYAAYAYWRFFDGTAWHWASPGEGLWSGACFLMLYWLVFTSAVFLSRDQRFAGPNRAAFLTLNNGAFFTLFLLTMLQVQQGGFWKFSLVNGGILLTLSLLARRWLAEEPLAANTYLTQGLLLITVGLISKFAGLQLALILAVESVLLLISGQQRKNVVLLSGAYVVAALSVGWGIDSLKQFDAPTLWLGIGLSVMMLANCWLAHRQLLGATPARTEPDNLVMRGQPLYFALLALAVCVVVTWNNTSGEMFPLVIATEALVMTFSIYILRIPEVTLLSQGLMLLAQAAWLVNWLDRSHSLPWWNPALVIGISLALCHWWPRQNVIQRKPANSAIWPVLYALAINVVLYCWFVPKNTTPSWLVTTSILALGLTVYGVATRAWFVAAASQLFILVGVVQFAWQLFQGNAPWQYPLAPIVAMGLLSFGTAFWFAQKSDANPRVREPLLQIAIIYRWFGLAMSVAWICEYIPARERIWVLGLLGLGIFIAAGQWRSRESLLFSAAFTVTGLAVFWMPVVEAPTVYVPNLLFILGLLVQAEIARRSPSRYPFDSNVQHSLIVLGGLTLWLFVSRWVLDMANGFYLTASWSVLALGLFSAGLLLRERMYRWLGLGILACALGRVVIFDVWKLEAIYRILSFMALGIVLLVLGFIYSKYQEKIKEWL